MQPQPTITFIPPPHPQSQVDGTSEVALDGSSFELFPLSPSKIANIESVAVTRELLAEAMQQYKQCEQLATNSPTQTNNGLLLATNMPLHMSSLLAIPPVNTSKDLTLHLPPMSSPATMLISPPGGFVPSPHVPGPPAHSPEPTATSRSALSPTKEEHLHAAAAIPIKSISLTHSSSIGEAKMDAMTTPTNSSSSSSSSPPGALRSICPTTPSRANLPPFLHEVLNSSREELAVYDSLILAKIANELGRAPLRDVQIVVGIPFYTEVANIHSVLVTMREVFQQRRQRALFIILGEFSRQDCIQEITDLHEIEMGEAWESERYVQIETMWKPYPKYSGKPWTVRALQLIANECGQDLDEQVAKELQQALPFAAPLASRSSMKSGAHLIILDADIQFNHWELSAQSLVNSLLDPLMSWDTLVPGDRPTAQPSPPLQTESYISASTTALHPPSLTSRNQPFYPSPLPLSLAGPARATIEAQPELETFSPIFSTRSPSDYAADVAIPEIPQPTRHPNMIKSKPPPATFVVLNAPRSFFADDGIVHLMTYLYSYMLLGVEIHQGHGGEFSFHKDLNRLLLQDETLVYDRCYCVESQVSHRAEFIHPQTHEKLFPSIPRPTPAAASSSEEKSSFSFVQSSSAIDNDRLAEGASVLEILMKGKWHAKITLNKLLAFEGESAVLNNITQVGFTASALPTSTTAPHGSNAPSTATTPKLPQSRARIDLVSEKLLNESIFFSSISLVTPYANSPTPIIHHVGGPNYIPDPDPKAQSLKVLAPLSTRKQMVKSLKVYYHVLLLEHVSSSGGGGAPTMNLPIASNFVQEFLPLLHRQVCKRQSSIAVNYIITHPRSSGSSDSWSSSKISEIEKEKYLIFGPEEWSKYTLELLHIYRQATKPEERRAVVCAHRLVWLLGCIAFLNDHSHCLWGHMHSTLHQIYGPIFRRKYLIQFLGKQPEDVDQLMKQEQQGERTNKQANGINY